MIFNLCLHVAVAASAVLDEEKSTVSCLSTCNYGTLLSTTTHSLSGPPPCCCVLLSFIDALTFFFHFYPSPTISPLSSSLFHSLSFLLSQCNVIQDRCWQPQLWHCNLCSALVARQPVWDRVRWCTSLSVCLQKKRERKRERERGRVAELAIRPSAKIQMIPPKCLCFQNGPLHICSAAEHIVSLGASGEYGFVTKTQLLAHRTARHISTVMLPTFWCVCDGNCCVQILCHHA